MNADTWITGINIVFLFVLGSSFLISAISFVVQFFRNLEKPRSSK